MISFWWILVIVLVSSLILATIFGLVGYYFSKSLAKWVKGVKQIDHRRDLEQVLPGERGWKLKEIVQLVRKVAHTHKIKMPEVGIYPSNEVNAFATGPANNTLIAFSTNLVNVMSPAELKGVIGHELSHLIHNDMKRILIVQGAFDAIYWTLSFLIGWFIFQPPKKSEEATAGDFIMWIFKWILFEIITTILRLIGKLIVLWYNRKREFKADLRGAEIVGIDNMLAALYKLLELENKAWIVDGIDLTEDEKTSGSGEPNSISLLKFNPEKKKRGILDLLRTHPRLEERIERLEEIKRGKSGRR